MGKTFLKETARLLQAKRQKRRWTRTVISLSLVVTLVTSSLLSHPAITMERAAACGMGEHTHNGDCYQHSLICGKEEQPAVEAKEEKILICQLSEHEHTSECQDADGNLICTQEAHKHGDDCYQINQIPAVEGHTHTDTCYQDKLVCQITEHKHSESCYPVQTEAAPSETVPETSAPSTEAQTSAPATEAQTTAPETEKAKKESKKEKKETEEVWEAQTLTNKGTDYTITVEASAAAKIPQDAVLKVRELKNDTTPQDYTNYSQQAEAKVQQQLGKEILYGRYFDLTIEADGKEIQPSVPVTVKVTYTKTVEHPQGSEIKVVFFGDQTEILNVTRTNLNNQVWSEAEAEVKSMTVFVFAGIGIKETEAPATEISTELETEITIQTEEITEKATEADSEIETEAGTEEATEVTSEVESESETEVITEEATEVTTEVESESETEVSTEETTEVESESESYVYESGEKEATVGNVTVYVAYGEDARILENAELVVTEVENPEHYLTKTKQILGDLVVVEGRFYDIHFAVNGEEYPISAEVEVMITLAGEDAIAANEEVKVVHFQDGEETPELIDSLNINGGNPAEPQIATMSLDETEAAESTVNIVTFTTDSFSVYGIVGTTDTTHGTEYRRTYTFQNDDGSPYYFTLNPNPESGTTTETDKQIVKNGETLQDVGIPTPKKEENQGKEFLGWAVVESNGTLGTAKKISEMEVVTGLKNDESVILRAVFSTEVTVTFYDVDQETILKTVKAESGTTLDLSKYEAVPSNPEEGFFGWSTEKSQSTASLANNYQVPGNDISLYPVIAKGHWLRFDANDTNSDSTKDDPTKATYSAPVFITGEITSANKPEPTRTGYTFGGWYETADPATTDEEFAFAGTLSESKILYAKWIPQNVNYTVVYWQENPDDYGFSYYRKETKQGTAGTETNVKSAASLTDASGKVVEGFKLHLKDEADRGLETSQEDADAIQKHKSYETKDAVIKGDGTTVVNVYYDREVYKIYYIKSEGSDTSTKRYSQDVNGEYYDFPGGYTQKKPSSYKTKGYYTVGTGPWSSISKDGESVTYYAFDQNNLKWEEKTYIFKRYKLEESAPSGAITDLTITAKYGASISDQWPSRRSNLGNNLENTYKDNVNWKVNQNGSTYQANISTMPLNGDMFYWVSPGSKYTLQIIYHVQDKNGGDIFSIDHTDIIKWNETLQTTKDDYYELRGFKPIFKTKDAASGIDEDKRVIAPNGITHYSASVGTFINKYNNYTVEFYYARNKYNIVFTPQDSTNTDTTKTYYYEASIANAAPTNYIKDKTTKISSNGEILTFSGWYDNPDGLGEAYDFTGKTMPANNIHLYGGWKSTTYKVTMNPNGGTFADGSTENKVQDELKYGSVISEGSLAEATKDGYVLIGWYKQTAEGDKLYDFSTQITEDITLVAHWRKIGSFHVRYVDSSSASERILQTDSKSYADQADVVVLPWPGDQEVPTGYEFIGWSYDSKIYYPGDTFVMDGSKAVTDMDGKSYITLYAQYTKLETTYIQYDANGGTGTLTDPSDITDNVQKDLPMNTAVKLSDGTGFTRTGYILIGWNTDKNADGTATYQNTRFQLGGQYGVNGSEGNVLYAEWASVNVEVSFEKQGAGIGDVQASTLQGAKFRLYNGKEMLKEATSGSDGKVQFEAVQYPTSGTLTVKEISAPAGYVLDTNSYLVTIGSDAVKRDDGQYYVTGTINNGIAVVNQRKTIDLTLIKMDQNGKGLSGARFNLYRNTKDDGTGNWEDALKLNEAGMNDFAINSSDGKKKINLPDGFYKLTETKAPDGYIIMTGSVIFKIVDGNLSEVTDEQNMMTVDNNNKTITIINQPGVALPNTGGSGTLPYTLSGLMVLLSAMMYGFVLRRRRERGLIS